MKIIYVYLTYENKNNFLRLLMRRPFKLCTVQPNIRIIKHVFSKAFSFKDFVTVVKQNLKKRLSYTFFIIIIFTLFTLPTIY